MNFRLAKLSHHCSSVSSSIYHIYEIDLGKLNNAP